MSYNQLVGKLAAVGVVDSEPNIRNKLRSRQIHGGVSDPMSNGNRSVGHSTKLVGWLLVPLGAASLILGVGYGLNEQAAYEQEARQKSSDYAEHAANKIRQICGTVAAREEAACIKDAVAEYRLKTRDNQREHDDLVAQRKSALWTSIMGIAALIGMGLSAIGVALVYTTFSESRKTNRLAMKAGARSTTRAIASAQETATALAHAEASAIAMAKLVEVSARNAEAQLRAYMDFASVGFLPPRTGDPNAIPIGVTITARNYGHTPALEVALSMQLRFSMDDGDDVQLLEEPEHIIFAITAPQDESIWTVEFGMPLYVWQSMAARQGYLILEIALSYVDKFEKPHNLSTSYRSNQEGRDFEFIHGTRQGD